MKDFIKSSQPAYKKHLSVFANILVSNTPHGKGILAAYDLAERTLLCKINGPSADERKKNLEEKTGSYYLQTGIHEYIEPRYPFFLFNHSCEPNCGINEQLELVTIKPVKKGEELCWDYSTSMLECGWKMKCTCGSPSCRKNIEDFDLLSVDLQKYYFEQKIVMPFIKRHIESRRRSRIDNEMGIMV